MVTRFARRGGGGTARLLSTVLALAAITVPFAIPPAADNAAASYAWINETLDPTTAAAIDNALGTGTPVESAVPMLDAPLQEGYHYDDLDAFFEQAPMNALAPFESDEYVTWPQVVEGWQQLKATA